MNSKPYPKEKRAFILNKSDDELWEFFQEILESERKKLTNIFPKAKGFRPKSLAGVHQGFRMLIKEARGPENSSNTQKAWGRILLIWMAWTNSHPVLQKLLKNYDNSADCSEQVPNTSLDIDCFTYLAKASHTHELSRSLIQRFYEFGYFQQDSRIELIIQTIPEHYEEVVENEMMLDKFKILEDLQVRVTQIETNHSKPDDSEQEQISLSLKKDWVEIKKEFDNVLTRVSTLEKNNEKLKNQLITFETLPHQLEKLSQTVNAINRQLDTTTNTSELDELKQQFGKLEKTLNDEISPTVENINQQLTNLPLKTEVNELKQQVDKLKEELSTQEKLIFDELEQHNATSPTHDGTGYIIQPTGLYTSKLQHSGSPRILSAKEELVSHLTDNLKAIGLIRGSAEKLAKEILAGLSAGEFIVFSGSLAFNLAEVCTQALAASAKQPPIVIHIPIGLLNGQQFGDYLWTAIKKAKMSEQICAIIIEGINRSALESYAQALRQIIIKRLLGQHDPAPNLLFFGTLVEGLSTLPTPLELCELGPIFNVDVLGWHSKYNAKEYQYGIIPGSDWPMWVTTMQNDSAEQNGKTVLDLADICNNFTFCHSHLWQVCVKKAYHYLDNNLQSLAFGWLVPRATTAELEWTKIKDWLLDDIFQEEIEGIPDKRLDKLLRNNLKDE